MARASGRISFSSRCSTRMRGSPLTVMVVAARLLMGNQSFSGRSSASQRLSPEAFIMTSKFTTVSLLAVSFTWVEVTATPRWRMRAVAFMSSFERSVRRIRTISPRNATVVIGSRAMTAASGCLSPAVWRKRTSMPSSFKVESAFAAPGVVGTPSEKTTSRRAISASNTKREPNSASGSAVEFLLADSAVPFLASLARARRALGSVVEMLLPKARTLKRSVALSLPEEVSISSAAWRMESGSIDSEISTR